MLFEKSFVVPANLGQILSDKINKDVEIQLNDQTPVEDVLSILYAENALSAIKGDFMNSFTSDSSELNRIFDSVRGTLYSNAKKGIEDKVTGITKVHFTGVLLAAYLNIKQSPVLDQLISTPKDLEQAIDNLFLLTLLKEYEDNNIEDISVDKLTQDTRFQGYLANRAVEDSPEGFQLLVNLPENPDIQGILQLNVNHMNADSIKDILNTFTVKEVEEITEDPVEEVAVEDTYQSNTSNNTECSGIIQEGSIIKVKSIKALEDTDNGISFQIEIIVTKDDAQ